MQTLKTTLADIALSRESYIVTRVLAANTAESITVPKGANYVILSGTADSWIDYTTTAVVPAADIENGTSPIYIPAAYKELREVKGVQTLSVISTPGGIFTAEFYS